MSATSVAVSAPPVGALSALELTRIRNGAIINDGFLKINTDLILANMNLEASTVAHLLIQKRSELVARPHHLAYNNVARECAQCNYKLRVEIDFSQKMIQQIDRLFYFNQV